MHERNAVAHRSMPIALGLDVGRDGDVGRVVERHDGEFVELEGPHVKVRVRDCEDDFVDAAVAEPALALVIVVVPKDVFCVVKELGERGALAQVEEATVRARDVFFVRLGHLIDGAPMPSGVVVVPEHPNIVRLATEVGPHVLGGVLAKDIGVGYNEFIVGELIDVCVEVEARVQAKLLEGGFAVVPDGAGRGEVDESIEEILGARVRFVLWMNEEADGTRVALLSQRLHEKDAHVNVGVAEGDVEVGLVEHYRVLLSNISDINFKLFTADTAISHCNMMKIPKGLSIQRPQVSGIIRKPIMKL